jgi:hypothetical protein
LLPKRENSLRRHSLIWQADPKPYWQLRACLTNQTAMEPKIVPACDNAEEGPRQTAQSGSPGLESSRAVPRRHSSVTRGHRC